MTARLSVRVGAVEYVAALTREGAQTLIEFPACPGCQTFADPDEDVAAVAREALEGWLEAREAQPLPRAQ